MRECFILISQWRQFFLNITQNGKLINKKTDRSSAPGHDGVAGTTVVSLPLMNRKLGNVHEAILLRSWITGRTRLQFLGRKLRRWALPGNPIGPRRRKSKFRSVEMMDSTREGGSFQKFLLGTSIMMARLYLHRRIPFKAYQINNKCFRLRMEILEVAFC